MLNRKMFRDIKKNLSQFITIFLMIMIGVMAYTGIKSYMKGMSNTSNKFYSENNMFDLEVIGNNLTDIDVEKIKEISNVEDAEGKLSLTATANDDKVLLVNFIKTNNISQFYVISGDKFDSNKHGVWLDAFYAKENNIKVGDTISINYNEISLDEPVIGLINVPDHIYDTKDESELYPNRKEFGFAYLSMNEIDYNLYNYIMVDVKDEDTKTEVKKQIERIVKGVTINREDTASYRTYQGEIDEGKTYVGIFSGLFIFIAMMSVITTMTRVIKNQRTQIGTLKALGFSNFKILMHYMSYGFYISFLGVIAGLLLGFYGIGKFFIKLEMSFFEIPNGAPSMDYHSYIVGICVILGVIIITYLTGKSILKENPSETLREEMPKVKKGSLDLTKKGILNKLSFSSKWNLRDILRNKIRTVMGLAGVTGCAMLIVCALGMLDSINHFIKIQFEDLYNFKYKLVLSENISTEEFDNLKNKYGNATSETLNIEIKKDDTLESNNIVVTDASDKLRFVDNKGKFISISNDGVFITYKLATNNGYKIGDEIVWHIYGDDTYYSSKIVGFNKDPQNQNITMTKDYLESLKIEYKPDSLYTNNDILKEDTKGVSIIQDKELLKKSMNSMLTTMKSMISLIICIAIFLGSVIIYNLGILSYSEKKYQFATLKVLGFTDEKIRKIFIKQNNWIAIFSIILGLPLGFYLTDYLFKVAIEKHYDFSAYISVRTYLTAALGTFIMSYIVSRYLSRKIKSIDMVSSLKSNE